MNIKRLFKKFCIIMVCAYLILGFCVISIKASNDDIGFTESELLSNEDYVVEGNCAYLKLEYDGTPVLTAPSTISTYIQVTTKNFNGVSAYYLEFKYSIFSFLDENTKKDIFENLKKSEMYESFTKSTKSKLIDMISDTVEMRNSTSLEAVFGDVEPDLIGGSKIYQPFNNPVRLVTAVVAIIAVILMTFSFVLDLFYINVPFIQIKIEDSKIAKYVSKSAKVYVKEMDDSSSVIQSSLAYFKDRVITMAVYGVLLVYLFEGKFISLIQAIVSLARGF